MAKSPPESPDATPSGTTGDQPLPSRRALREAARAAEAAQAAQGSTPAEAPQRETAPAPLASSPKPAPLPEAPTPPLSSPADSAAADHSSAAWAAEHNPFAGLGFGTPADGSADAPVAGREAVPGEDGSVRPPGRTSSRANRRARLSAQLDDQAAAPKKSRKGAWGCLIVLVIILGLMGAAAFALQGPISQLIAATQEPEDYEGSGSGEVLVMIHDGDTGSDIANTLLDQDVVKSYDAFYDLLLAQPTDPVFQPGAYLLASQMSSQAALTALQDPATRQELTVVIPEGTAAVDVLASLSEGTDIPLADLQAAAADLSGFGLPAEATTLEGFLFPATYTFQPGVTAHDAIKTLVDRQFQALDEAGVPAADRWKTIVMASLVQREAGLRDDYYKVAKVFYNRLDPAQWDSGLLQSDATVAYGTGNTHLVTTTDAERADANNAYNTYVHPGLPVGPISNPGDLAIDATLHPADGTWLFFVTWNLDTGETIFSTTAAEHDAGVEKWLAWMDEHPEYG
ncbi:endolytic transglycosylase MltG [Cryobacterium sp. SO2]|uniref:endolytic transglycosylase MltG n=1 Tax=Cryobacterium sp. SO2 TaxID=1897060 RepID=UPI00223CD8D9|nr:endolytic transglycosylase MltG [Cryobacterium sp. SO2]WEO75704.1 endolytic transglycosylase MltG [Cryobacterium sp. SO2]